MPLTLLSKKSRLLRLHKFPQLSPHLDLISTLEEVIKGMILAAFQMQFHHKIVGNHNSTIFSK